MSRSIAFIDSRVTDYKTLLAGFDPATEIFVLDALADGLAQMAAVLAGRVDVDSVHVVSHGSQGTLYLGNTVIDSASLPGFSQQLASIKSALSPDGDILLYGCDVAQGDAGQAFIVQLAELTGADVAASDDLTGAVALGGDWVLETHTGAIESAVVISTNFNETLSVTQNSSLQFSARNASIFGLGAFSIENDILNYELPQIMLPDLGLPGGGSYSFSLDHAQFGLFVEAGISGGAYDFLYPIDSSVKLPSNVRPGDTFTVDTTFVSLSNPQLSIDGPSIALSAHATADIELSSSIETSIFGTDVNFNFDTAFGGDLTIFDLAGLVSGHGDLGSFGYEYNIDPNALDGDGLLVYQGSSLQQITVEASPGDPFVQLVWDIDDSFPALSAWDQEYEIAGFDVEAGLLSIDAIISASPYLTATTHITGVQVTLTPSVGEVQVGMLGDYFQFSVPADYSGPDFSITADYQLLGNISFEYGLQIEGGLEIKFGEFQFEGGPNWLAGFGADFSVFKLAPSVSTLIGLGEEVVSLADVAVISNTYTVSVSDAVPTDVVVPDSAPDAVPVLSVTVLGANTKWLDGRTVFALSEGNAPDTAVTFRITRSDNLTEILQASYTFALGTEVVGNDFVGGLPAAGSLTFAPGEIYKDVILHIAGDTVAELNESVKLQLTAADAVVRTPTTTLLIESDDGLKIYANGWTAGSQGDDLIIGSGPSDNIVAGPGSDTINLTNGTADGGSGIDTVNITSITASNFDGSTRWVAQDADGVQVGAVNYGSSYADITMALLRGTSFSLQNFYYINWSYGGSWNTQLTLKNVENWSVLAGTADNDLLIVHGTGTTYDGAGGSDMLYADWSAATAAIVFDSNVTAAQVLNGVTVRIYP